MATREGTGADGAGGIIVNLPRKDPKKTWTVEEEQHLIGFLYELVDSGQKSDNGFRGGYHGTLVTMLQKKMPGHTFLIKHIKSKMTQWKKDYATVENMLAHSGIGWNHEDKTIDCEDQVWEEYARTHKEARGKRHKVWIYYNDWCQLFGKDRANGNDSENVVEMIQNILVPAVQNQNEKDLFGEGGGTSAGASRAPNVHTLDDSDDEQCDLPTTDPEGLSQASFVSLLTQEQKSAAKKLKGKIFTPRNDDGGSAKSSKRQKFTKGFRVRDECVEDPNLPSMASIMAEAKSTIQNLESKFDKALDTDDDISSRVIAALDKVADLTPESRIFLGMYFMDKPSHRSFFLQSSEENQRIMAFMVLEDKKV